MHDRVVLSYLRGSLEGGDVRPTGMAYLGPAARRGEIASALRGKDGCPTGVGRGLCGYRDAAAQEIASFKGRIGNLGFRNL